MEIISELGNPAECRINEVQSTRPEDELFGRLFADVDACRLLMKEKQVLASGSALLRVLRPGLSWIPSDIDLYASRTSLGKEGLAEWHEFLSAEGYVVVNKQSGLSGSATYVSATHLHGDGKLMYSVFRVRKYISEQQGKPCCRLW